MPPAARSAPPILAHVPQLVACPAPVGVADPDEVIALGVGGFGALVGLEVLAPAPKPSPPIAVMMVCKSSTLSL